MSFGSAGGIMAYERQCPRSLAARRWESNPHPLAKAPVDSRVRIPIPPRRHKPAHPVSGFDTRSQVVGWRPTYAITARDA